MEKTYGWAGKVLHVDLTTGKVEKIPTSDYKPEEFIGGVGMNARIFWELGCPEVEAYDPDNPLIISAGPLTGIYGPFGRAEVVSLPDAHGAFAQGASRLVRAQGRQWGRPGVDGRIPHGRLG